MVNSNEAKRKGDDSFAAMKQRAADADYTMPYVVDQGSKLANACGARTTPHVFLYNKDLTLAYRGAIDDNVNKAEEVKEPYLNLAADPHGGAENQNPRNQGCWLLHQTWLTQ